MKPADALRRNEINKKRPANGLFILVISLLIGFSSPFASWALLPGEEDWEAPLGLDEDFIVIPKDNPLTKEKIELGKLLFFDKRLSKNNTIACGSCHMPSLAFTDGQPVSTGIHRLQGGRSAPASINRLFSSAQFWMVAPPHWMTNRPGRLSVPWNMALRIMMN